MKEYEKLILEGKEDEAYKKWESSQSSLSFISIKLFLIIFLLVILIYRS